MLSLILFTLLANGATSIFVFFLFHLVVDNIQQLPTSEKCHYLTGKITTHYIGNTLIDKSKKNENQNKNYLITREMEESMKLFQTQTNPGKPDHDHKKNTAKINTWTPKTAQETHLERKV